MGKTERTGIGQLCGSLLSPGNRIEMSGIEMTISGRARLLSHFSCLAPFAETSLKPRSPIKSPCSNLRFARYRTLDSGLRRSIANASNLATDLQYLYVVRGSRW